MYQPGRYPSNDERRTSYIVDPNNVSASAHALNWEIFGLTLYVVDGTEKMDQQVSIKWSGMRTHILFVNTTG